VGSTTQGITISVGNLQASNNVNIVAASERGQYGAGAANQTFPMTVGPPGAGTALKLGVTVHADGTQVDTTVATPSFDVTVVYQ